jgi:osmoprotectant transport system permease protein
MPDGVRLMSPPRRSPTQVGDTQSIDAPTPDDRAGRATTSRAAAVKSNAGLVISPLIIVCGAPSLLYLNYQRADKIFQDERALDWNRNLRPQLEQHLSITLWSTVFTILISVPLGIALTRPATSGSAARSSRWPPPVRPSPRSACSCCRLRLARTWSLDHHLGPHPVHHPARAAQHDGGPRTGQQVVIEAGRGMGLTKFQVLRQIELPLAVPVILAGVRTALVITVGMAALAFLIGGGGLGATINAGLGLSRDLVLITGAGLTALVALTVDWIAALIEKTLRPAACEPVQRRVGASSNQSTNKGRPFR